VANAASGVARAHEVAGPLHVVIREAGLPAAVLDTLIAARRWEVGQEPHADAAALARYLDETAGGLMWLACIAAGARAGEEAARDIGWAAGLAAYLRAAPDLAARGRSPFVDDSAPALAALAREGLDRLARGRAGGPALGPGRVATLAAWQAGPVLRQVVADPGRVAVGRLGLSEFARRGRLVWAGWRGRV
jgi:phytoene/squalene synthetase